MNSIITRYFEGNKSLFIYRANSKIPITLKGSHAEELWKVISSERNENSIDKAIMHFISEHAQSAEAKRVSAKSFKDVWKIIREDYERNGMPMSCFLEVTSRCNYSCNHCYLSNYSDIPERELDFDEIAGILHWLRTHNAYKVTISGGEPFIRKDVFRILEHAHRDNFVIHVFSNIALLDEDDIDHLERLGVRKIEASIYAYSESAYRKITGSSSKGKVYKNLERLTASSIDVVVKTPILRDNCKEIPLMVAEFSQLGVRYIVDPLQMQSGYYASLENDVFCDLPLLESVLDAIDYKWTFKIDREDSQRFVCGGGARNL